MRYVPQFVKGNPAALSVWRAVRDPWFSKTAQLIADALPWWRPQTIVQIGTNDGVRDDPVYDVLQHRRLWRGLLVEPLPLYFRELTENYGPSRRFMFENAAIGKTNGSLSFYAMGEDARLSPDWLDYFDRIGSLDRNMVIRSLDTKAGLMERFIVETKVPTMTLGNLLSRHGIHRVDCLVTDAEGYDAEIIRQALQLGLTPRVILYESGHFTGDEHDSITQALAGYELQSVDALNTIAIFNAKEPQ